MCTTVKTRFLFVRTKSCRPRNGTRPARGRASRHDLWRVGADQEGAALIEFSIVAPLLLLLCFGITQYGLLFFVYGNMYDAAREAARMLSVGSADEAQAKQFAVDRRLPWLKTWTVVAEDVGTTGTNQVRVTITVPGGQAGIINFAPLPDQLQARVVFRKEK